MPPATAMYKHTMYYPHWVCSDHPPLYLKFQFLLTIRVKKCEMYHMQYLLPHPFLAFAAFASADLLYVAIMRKVSSLISVR